jgi:hypothetical protein
VRREETASAVTGQQRRAINWVSTVLTARSWSLFPRTAAAPSFVTRRSRVEFAMCSSAAPGA